MLSQSLYPPKAIRIMLVDDSKILLQEAVRFLRQDARVQVVGTVSTAAKAVEQVLTFTPDVVLLDVTVDGVDGLPVLHELYAMFPALPIIVLDAIRTESVKHAARKHGASAFVVKTMAETYLLPVIFSAVPIIEHHA